MFRRPAKRNWFYIAGCVALAGAISAQRFARLPDFAAGALMGVAIGLLLVSLCKPSACSSN